MLRMTQKRGWPACRGLDIVGNARYESHSDPVQQGTLASIALAHLQLGLEARRNIDQRGE
jgi:hypothetical protein